MILSTGHSSLHSLAALVPDFDMGRLTDGALLSGAAELGDPTFFLIVVLTAYCPFQGLRSMRGAMLQRLFILLGAAGAIATHIALIDIRTKMESKIDLIVGSVSVVILALTSLR